MSKEKQIEEMAEMLEIIENARETYANDVTDHTENEYIREGLLNARYRKQSEGEWLKLASRYAHAEGFPPNATDAEKEGYLEALQHRANCSVCFSSFDDRDTINWNFCPSCGAKMRKENN